VTIDPRLLGSLRWRSVGPHRGGRVVAVAGHPTEAGTFYFGACAGGVWKTTDGGLTWLCVSDGFFTTAAVGALAVAPSDPNVIYAGTGEACIRNDVSHGDGVYKSTDAGKTWKRAGLQTSEHLGDILIDPRNSSVVYVASQGPLFSDGGERGLYKTTDGGATWSAPVQIAGPMPLSWFPNTSAGRMFGDYISTSILAGDNAYPVVPVATAPVSGAFRVSMRVPTGGMEITGGSVAS